MKYLVWLDDRSVAVCTNAVQAAALSFASGLAVDVWHNDGRVLHVDPGDGNRTDIVLALADARQMLFEGHGERLRGGHRSAAFRRAVAAGIPIADFSDALAKAAAPPGWTPRNPPPDKPLPVQRTVRVASRAQVRRLAKGTQLYYVDDYGKRWSSSKDEVVRKLGGWLDDGLAVDAELTPAGVVLRRVAA